MEISMVKYIKSKMFPGTMNKKSTILGIAMLMFGCTTVPKMLQAQNPKTSDFKNLSWKEVATQMPDEWYGSKDAEAVAENVLFAQLDIGGWAKNKPYHLPFSKK